MDTPLSRQLAAFCHGLDFNQLPPEVVDRAKYFFLDYLGVAVRGSLSESSQPVYRLAAGPETPGGGTIWAGLKRPRRPTRPWPTARPPTAWSWTIPTRPARSIWG